MSHVLREELKRFKDVVAARKSVRELLALFEQLHKSTKFTDAAKPMCFGHLIQACVNRIPDEFLMDLQVQINEFGAAKLVRGHHLDDDADLILRDLVARLFRTTAGNPEDCNNVFRWLESSGIAPTRLHSLGLALEAGMSEDELDIICDMTQPLYYAGTFLARSPAQLAVPA